MTAGYYRYPTIHKNNVVFVSEDDLWSVSASGGTARRLTSNLGEVSNPVLSPDGKQLAFVGRDEGPPEVYIMPAEGGSARRLTFLGSLCRVVGWNPEGTHILFCSSYGQITFGTMSLFQIAADSVNGEAEELPYGPVRSVTFGPKGQMVIGRNGGDPARWKRYRGGTAGHLWIRSKAPKTGSANLAGDFAPLLAALDGNIATPMWLTVKGRNRIFFVSDHEGIANLYSCTPKGKDLRRHTDHEEYFVRFPSTDGKRIVYHAGADIYVYDAAKDSAKLLKVKYLSPRVQRNRKFVSTLANLESADFYPSGKAVTVISRGKPFTLYHQDGPSYQHGERNGIRYRHPIWFNDGDRLLMLSDKDGEEAFEIHFMDLDKEPLTLEGLDIGRPIRCKMSPTADKLALTNHRHELILIDLEGVGKLQEDTADPNADEAPSNASGAKETRSKGKDEETANSDAEGDSGDADIRPYLTIVDHSPHNPISDFDWAPDGNWLAYDFSATMQTTCIRLYRLPDPEADDESLHEGAIHTVTQPVLDDLRPSFDPEGKYLYFLSRREFNPTYDGLHFDLGFPMGMRPYLITLQADLPNPFIPRPDDDDDLPSENAGEESNDDDEPKDEADDTGTDDDTDSEDSDAADDGSEEEAGEDGEDADDEGSSEDGALAAEEASVAASESVDADDDSASETDEEDQDSSAGEKADEAKADDEKNDDKEADDKKADDKEADDKAKKAEKPKIKIDLEGIERRVLAFPVPEGRYGQIAGVSGKAVFTVYPVSTGVLGNRRWDDEQYQGATLRSYDFREYRSDLLADRVGSFKLSRDRKRLLYYSGGRVRVIGAGEKAPPSTGGNARKSGWVDLSRIRVSVDRPSEWHQMLREAWRLQRDHFWSDTMSGIDWIKVYERYSPLVSRVSTRGELSDLIWEMQGELGTSHAYEFGGDYRYSPYYSQGFLGTKFKWNAEEKGYEIGTPVLGDPWDPYATSPLAGPGTDVRAGDILVAINGQRLDEETSPSQLLVNYAWTEVLLTFKSRPPANGDENPSESDSSETAKSENTKLTDKQENSASDGTQDGAPDGNSGKTDSKPAPPPYRNLSVKTLFSETPAYYRDWVEHNRKQVHEATEGRVGYVHIPDMSAYGYAEFHRGFLAEIDRDGLVVDVRYNGGGHVSQLILEKLARRRIGFDMSRWGQPVPYPADSVAGPMVALTNEQAGSDGDIFCHCFKLMKLGPLIGKRTWGGVIGIAPKVSLVDGSITTQPEYSFWFEDVGWSVENYGTDPDIEVEYAPQDYAAGVDPQLDRAISEVSKLLKKAKILKPDLESRPNLALPQLPPRKGKRRSSKKKQ